MVPIEAWEIDNPRQKGSDRCDGNTTVNSFNGIQTFPSQSPFGMNGRTLYARIGRTF